MKKVNRNILNVTTVFIVLLSTFLFTSNVVRAETLYVPSGDGTPENPYVIDVSDSSSYSVTFKAETFPFDFTIAIPSTYKVEHDVTENTVTFTMLGGECVVPMNADKYSDINNWQLGVSSVKSSLSTSTQPAYAISEISAYETESIDLSNQNYIKRDGTVTMYSSSWEENGGDGGESVTYSSFNANFGTIGTASDTVATRTMTLSNAVSGSSAEVAAENNVYYFTNISNGKSLYTVLGYRENANTKKFNSSLLFNADFLNQKGLPAVISMKNATALTYRFNGNSNSALEDVESVGAIEEAITRLLVSFGDKVLLELLRSESVLGPDLSIDALVFDEYEKTKLNLYGTSSEGDVNSVLKEVVNYWFNAFEILAYVVYMIILVYIGIMIILNSGSGKQDKWKSYIGNWIVGLILLAVLPRYGIPYLFKINSALVGYVGNGHKTMQTYYNYYNSDVYKDGIYEDIMGSDSTTISVEELTGLREQLVSEQNSQLVAIKEKIKSAFNKVSAKAKQDLHSDGNKYTVDIDTTVDKYVEERFKYFFSILNGYIERELSDEEIEKLLVKIYPYNGNFSFSTGDPNEILYRKLSNTFSDVFLTDDHQNVRSDFMESISEYCQLGRDIGIVDDMIEIVKTDLMGMMRAYAGKYRRIVFALLWYVLFFQLISLVFIYFKRIFIIAILIAIFPLIMMSYAVDKMNDGKSQTFSLWLRELLANVFIQSVHAIIYAIFIDLGLEIYEKDSGNWIFLMASVIMLLPAESLLKDLFGLQGSTVGRLGGMAKQMLAGGIAAFSLATSFRGKKDASVTAKNNARFNKLQNRQNRADSLASARRDDSIARRLQTPSNAKEARKLNRQEAMSNIRDKAYAIGSEARNVKAKVAPHVDNAVRTARNVAGATIGAGIALSGGDVNSLQEGAQVAKAITGKTKNLSENKVDIKSNLSSAYKRNKEKTKNAKP